MKSSVPKCGGTTRKVRVLIAGQPPPPVGGQTIFIRDLLHGLAESRVVDVEPWEFSFSPTLETMRRPSLWKGLALIQVVFDLFRLRLKGPIDVILYPVAGPHLVPLVRDIFLLPWALLLGRRVILQFHAAGVAASFASRRARTAWLVKALYRRASAAVVMTPFNRPDAEWARVSRIYILPHRLPDCFEERDKTSRDCLQVLCLGILCVEKGTVDLLEAAASLQKKGRIFHLHLAGHCLHPFTAEDFTRHVRRLDLEDCVTWHGVAGEEAKKRLLARADLAVCPTRAPYESFGLVFLEALMWGLPVVVSDWRGNREIAGEGFEGEFYAVEGDVAAHLAQAMEVALSRVEAQPGWGDGNRQIFLDRYHRRDWSDYERLFLAEAPSAGPVVVVAGQTLPLTLGQARSTLMKMAELRESGEFAVLHWPFYFTTDVLHMRKASFSKVLALSRAWWDLLAIRAQGKIACLIYPTGGPQTVPLVRDLLLLPLALLAAQKVVLQFHAAGVADRFAGSGGVLGWLIRGIYSRAPHAIVMTPFNKRDPEWAGIPQIHVLPHHLADRYAEEKIVRGGTPYTILSLGHLCPDKGIDHLLPAFADFHHRHPASRLRLVGECLPPWSEKVLRSEVARLGLSEVVEITGVLQGDAKDEALATSDLFVFSSTAPYESYGRVLVEAMMWALPMVVSRWRGNLDVVGEDFDGVSYPVEGDRTADLANALTEAYLAHQHHGAVFGKKNRSKYLARFRSDGQRPYVELVKRVCGGGGMMDDG